MKVETLEVETVDPKGQVRSVVAVLYLGVVHPIFSG